MGHHNRVLICGVHIDRVIDLWHVVGQIHTDPRHLDVDHGGRHVSPARFGKLQQQQKRCTITKDFKVGMK